MDYTGQGLTYALLVLPGLFAITFFVQGVVRLSRNEPSGSTSMGFGVILLFLIVIFYMLFIR